MELSKEQQFAFEKFKLGENLFMTGPGGTGKTQLIKHMVEYLIEQDNHKFQVCALTGCAAILLQCQAKTIHSWSGIGLGTGDVNDIVKRVARNKYKSKVWHEIQTLIVDEVSMMSLKLFNILDKIARIVKREYHKPFGGIQLVFSGDFYQLPPVGDEDEPDTCAFCFESPIWNETFPNNIELIRIFRQNDEKYTKILNQIRKGVITKSSYECLMDLTKKTSTDPLMKPTILNPTRRAVEYINNKEMDMLPDEIKSFTAELSVNLPITKGQESKRARFTDEEKTRELNYLMNNIMCDKVIHLKKGSQVLCIANLEMEGRYQICNGSQGVIVDFKNEYPIVKFNNGAERVMVPHIWASENIPGVGVIQVPLILAWALTIHKSQGSSLDMASIDVGSGIFECGQTYVALSRVKSLEGLYLKSFDPKKIKINKKVKQFYESIATTTTIP